MAGMGSFSPNSSKIDQIISEFFAKSAHIILESRIPFICSQIQTGKDSPASSASSSSLGLKSKDRWFNLVLGDCPAAQESVEPWRRNPSEPMIVDVLLVRSPGWLGDAPHRARGNSPGRIGTPDSWSGGEGEDSSSLYGTVLERWVISHERQGSGREFLDAGGVRTGNRGRSASSHALEVPGIYKRAVILMRSLYCILRTLPAHRLLNLANSSSHNRSFSLSYRISASPPPLAEADEAAMTVRTLAPVETPTGRMCVSVAYRHTTAVTALEITPPILPRIIADYVGSPTTDPLRRLSSESLTGSVPSGGISGRRGVHVVSLPSSVPSSPSGQLSGRRHSWGGGLNKVQPALLPPSSPSFRSSRSSSPSHPDYHPSPPRLSSPLHYLNSPQSCPSGFQRNSSQPIPIQGVRRSPPVPSSLSPSPPGISHSLESSLLRHTSAPVNIPKPSGLRGPQMMNFEPNANRSALPPPSPSPRRTIEHPQQPSYGVSNLSAGQFTGREIAGSEGGAPRLSISTLAESLLLISPSHPYHAHQVAGDDKVEDGPPSGVKRSLYGSPRVTLSRSSSKLSCHDDADDEEFACPFAVDDDELEELRGRAGSPGSRNRPTNFFEASGPKSQHAAVGALVRLLKTVQPLQGRPGADLTYSGPDPYALPMQTVIVKSKSGTIPGSHKLQKYRSMDAKVEAAATSSGQMCKTTAEALEELRGYKEMRGFFLLRQGGRKCTEKQLPSQSPTNVL